MEGANLIYLVACVSQKTIMPQPQRAKDLYISDWFLKARAFAESTGKRWFIISAKYRLLHPDAQVAPYNEYLGNYPADTRKRWAREVAISAATYVNCTQSQPREIVLLAGNLYREFLTPELELRGFSVTTPLAGLGIGEQKKWFLEHMK